jgi:hypothetical protein
LSSLAKALVQEKNCSRTACFRKFGLHAGIEELCLEFSSSKVEVDNENKTNFDIADNDRHLHVFRILQELMNNSLRMESISYFDCYQGHTRNEKVPGITELVLK